MDAKQRTKCIYTGRGGKGLPKHHNNRPLQGGPQYHVDFLPPVSGCRTPGVSGYFGIQQRECEARSCCWSPLALDADEGLAREGPAGESDGGGDELGCSGTISSRADLAPRPPSRNDVPWCFFPNGQEYEPVYDVESVQHSDPGERVVCLRL